MPEISNITIFISRILFLVFITLPFSFCNGQASEKSEKKSIEKEDIAQNTQRVIFNQNTLYPQIHTNLNGMVSEFVRTMYQDKNGTMWLVTDGNGIFKYNESKFTHLTNKNGLTDNNATDILEDNKGQLWFGIWQGISLYDGDKFMDASDKEP